MIDNLLMFYGMATNMELSQVDWYRQAHEECRYAATRCGVDFKTFVWVVAVLSPLTRWEQNISIAEEMVRHGRCRIAFSANQEKARRILAGDLGALRGPKVTRFAWSLYDPHNTERVVVVDTWAIRAWEGRVRGPVNCSRYKYHRIAQGYREAAALVGMEPAAFQAVVWSVVRNLSRRSGQLMLDI